MKKTISMLLAIVMLLSLVMVLVAFSFSASADETAEYDITIKVHYYREDGDYSDWEVHMWNGVESLDATRAFEQEEVTYEGTAYGVTATYYADAADSWVGFIVKKPDWTKDPDGDRKIDVSDVLSGTVHVYAKSGSALEDYVVDKSEAQVGAKVTAAVYDSINDTLTVTTAVPIEGSLNGLFELEGPDGKLKVKGVTNVEGTCDYVLDYQGKIDSENIFTVYYKGTPCVVTVPNIYSTEYFEGEYTYTGNDLGVNYVHLLPVYDINSVDETVGGYNWGYDPKNYNVPEGSYSTDPYNGAVRVTEFKQMVQSLHDNGIGVVMDVVYNHVADAGNFCFNQIVPGYFSRIHDDGSYQSNSD